MNTVQTDLLNDVNNYLSDRAGLYFTEPRYADLERGLRNAAQELGYDDIFKCIKDLLANQFSKSQLQVLVRDLTIGETYFFRDPAVFVLLEEKILPELIRKKRADKTLRIWSAGCSTGEEPYSIAISILRTLPDFEKWKISLLATDINTQSLEKAKNAVYTPWSFRTMPPEFFSLYFEKNGNDEGQYSPKTAVKNMVAFDYLNLAEDPYPSITRNVKDFDIIFCRNVLIYFTQKRCNEIADQLCNCLDAEGLLVTSATDSSRLINSSPQSMKRISSTMLMKKPRIV
jgi:chemotaxis protein methyltransferase CheR